MSLIPVSVAKPIFRSALILKKNSPNLMFGVGVGGFIATTVLACRATLKLSDQLQTMKSDLDSVRYSNLDELEKKRALAIVHATNAGTIVRMYSPTIAVGALTIGAFTGAHVQLTRRNAGLTAAYAAISKAYDDYRDRVREEFGEQKELEIYRPSVIDKVEVEPGRFEEVHTVPMGQLSPYAVMFDAQSTSWQKIPDLNMMFLKGVQAWANQRLQHRGHLFLNEVYDDLGLPHTKKGAVVGWVFNSERGDNYVDFGIVSHYNDRFARGWEAVAILDFNVDGVIYDLI